MNLSLSGAGNSYATATLNRFWSAIKFSDRAYSAKRNDGETRLYFSREALERDFGPVKFIGEKGITAHEN